MADQPNEDITALSSEIARINESATCSAQSLTELSKPWRTVNLLLSALATILAAVSSAPSFV